MYLNHPGDAVKTIKFKSKFGDPNKLPLDVWFEGMKPGDEVQFFDSNGKPHQMTLISISPLAESGSCIVRYVLDSELMSYEVQIGTPKNSETKGALRADPNNIYHVGAPSSGDLWIMYVHPGDIVKKGDELFNVSIMKQEKSVLAPVDGIVKRVFKNADYRSSKKMVPVKEGELLVELAPAPLTCANPACGKAISLDDAQFCPHCGKDV